MKLIYTNKNGFGVHSPFIYSFITNVLFPDAEFYSFETIRTVFSDKNQQEIIQIIYRLINYYQPKNILYVGALDEQEQFIYREISKNINHFWYSKGMVKNKNLNGIDFVIMSDIPANLDLEELLKGNKLICLKNSGRDVLHNKIFANALKSKNIQITLKFKNFGIIIVNKNFQKQNYVIKSTNHLQI